MPLTWDNLLTLFRWAREQDGLDVPYLYEDDDKELGIDGILTRKDFDRFVALQEQGEAGMTWTTEVPTQPDWYWMRHGEWTEAVRLADLDLAGENELRLYRIGMHVERLDLWLEQFGPVEWAGPLEPLR